MALEKILKNLNFQGKNSKHTYQCMKCGYACKDTFSFCPNCGLPQHQDQSNALKYDMEKFAEIQDDVPVSDMSCDKKYSELSESLCADIDSQELKDALNELEKQPCEYSEEF